MWEIWGDPFILERSQESFLFANFLQHLISLNEGPIANLEMIFIVKKQCLSVNPQRKLYSQILYLSCYLSHEIKLNVSNLFH